MDGDWKRVSCHRYRTFIAAGVFPVEYGDKAKLLFTDTDSLTYMYEIETEDVNEDFSIDGDKENSPFYADKTNKKVIGKFKQSSKTKRRADKRTRWFEK